MSNPYDAAVAEITGKATPSANPYDDVVRNIVGGGPAGAIRNAAQFSGDASADREARLQHTARFLRAPVDSVRAFPEAANDRMTAAQIDAEGIAKNAPVTARKLSTVDGMREYKDSTGALVGIEQQASKLKLPSMSWSDFKEAPETFLLGIGGAGNQLIKTAGLIASAPFVALDALANAHPLQRDKNTNLSDFAFKYFVDPYARNESAFDVSNRSFIGKASAALGGATQLLAQAVLTGGSGTVKAGEPVTSAVKQIIEHGIKSAVIPASTQAVDTAQKVYEATDSGMAALNAGTSQFVATNLQLLLPVTAAGAVIPRTAIGAVGGAVGGEAGRQIMNMVLPDTLRREFDPEQAMIDGLIGGVFGWASRVRNVKDPNAVVREMYVEAQRAGEATQGAEAVRALSAYAAEVRTREINPQGFHDFVSEVATEVGTKDLYVDVRKFTEIMNQSGVTIDELNSKMPDVANQIKEATETNGLVRIPLADYATHIAGGKLDEVLFQEMKTSPDGMTFKEAEAYQKEVAQGDMLKQAESIVKAHEQDTEYQNMVKQVFDTRLNELSSTGRFNRETNRVYATMDTAFIVTQAERLGMTPDKFMETYPLRVRAEGVLGSNTLDQESVPQKLRKAMSYLTPEEQSRLTTRSAESFVELMTSLPSEKEMAAVAFAGSAKRGWYQKSAEAISTVFGPDAVRFAKLLSALSPQTSVETNFYNALSVWRGWLKAGRPQDPEVILDIMGANVQGGGTRKSVLPAWVSNSVRALTEEDAGRISGPKVNSFHQNLIGNLEEVTNDAWMANYALVDAAMFSGALKASDAGVAGKGAGYLAMNAQVRKAAELLTKLTGEKWYPAEVQETIWSWAKTLYEAQDSTRSAVDIIKERTLTPEMIASTPDFGTLFGQSPYKNILEEAGYGQNLRSLESGRGVDGTIAEPGAEGKAAPFAEPTQQRYEIDAARRLTKLYKDRALAKQANTLNQNALVSTEPALDGLPRFVKVDGKEVEFGPFKPARDAARQYADSVGMVYAPPRKYVKVNEDRATRIAEAFEQMKHDPENPEVKAAYDAMIEETLAQWEAIKKTGLKVEFITGDDPYGNPRNAILDVVNNNHLWVFPTDAGFGGSESANVDITGNPLLRIVEGETISGKPVRANDIFRIVHDYFGHIKEGVGFRADGEENAWRAHSAMYSPLARKAMTTETRGQNSWVNFGPFAEQNRTANGADTQYAPQKIGLLPDWVVTEGAGDVNNMAQSAKDTAISVEGIHFSREPRTVLSGGAYGTGVKGAEADRVKAATDSRIKSRIAFYVNTGNGIVPEPGVGGVPHRAELRNMYDADADPLNIYATAQGDMNAFESAVLDAGFSGYVTRSFGTRGAAVVLNTSSVPVTPEPAAQRVDNARVIEAPVLSDEKMLRKEFLNNPALPMGAMDAARWRATLERVAPKMISYLGDALNFEGTRYKDELLRAALNQGERGQISFGNIRDGAQITLLKNADLSTYIHESGHWYTEVLTDIAARPDAPAQTVEDANKLLVWAGIPGGLAEWTARSFENRREAHEKIARGIETYLFEGRAPTTELQSVFSKIRSWMMAVYRSIRNLNAELTPEVRQVFDRMLATDSAIAESERVRKMTAMFETKPEGMSEQEYLAYQNLGATATDAALNELDRRSLRDMKWLSNAKAKVMRELQKEANDRRKEVRDEVTKEVMNEPVNKARDFLRTGEIIDAEGNEIKLTEGFRLNSEMVKEMYPETMLSRPDTSKLRGLTAKDGLAPDTIAQMFGFTSGDHLIRELIDAENPKEKIAGLVDQRMLERHGDLIDPVSIERAAEAAIHNDVRARFIATELHALTKAIGSPRDLAKAAKLAAETAVAAKRLRDLTPGKYAAAESTASKNSMEAFKKGDTETAAFEKRAQLLNNQLVKAILDAQERARVGATYLKKFTKDGTRKNIDPEYLDQIDAILENYDLKARSNKESDRRKSYANWAKAQEEMGLPPVVDAETLADLLRVPIKDLTVDQFKGLVDTVKNIEHLGRLKQKMLTLKDKREFAAVVKDVTDSIRENATKVVPEALEREPIKSAIKGFFSVHRKPANLVREMDGWKDGGAFWDVFIRNMNEAGDREAVMREQAAIKLNELTNDLRKEGKLGEKMYIPEINASLSRAGRISIALNWGNEANRQRVLGGERWSEAQVQAVLDTLTEREWKFVDGVWKFLDTYWPEIAAKERRVTGTTPERVEPTPVQTKFGKFDGGYYPIAYDIDRSSRAESQSLAETIKQSMQGAFTRATTRRGHTKARVEEVTGRPVSKSLDVIFQHVNQVVHDLSWHEYLIDANRLLRNPEVDSAIREHYGVEYTRELKKALEDIAVGDIPAQNAFERSVDHIRAGATIAGLGWNLTTALLQPIGLTQSMVRIGPTWVAKGLTQFLGDAARMENTAARIAEKSDMMRLRAKTLNRDIFEAQGALKDQSNIRTAINTSAFYLIAKLQLIADIPTWLGQYEKSIAAGADEARAIALADQAVLDAQGGGQTKDLAQIQRGGSLQKLFTTFYSFFNTTYNLAAEIKGRTDLKDPIAVGRAAADYILLFIVPAVLGTALKAAMKGELDDEEALARKIAAEQMGFVLGTMVGARELGSAAQALAGEPGTYTGPASISFFADVAKLTKQVQQGEMDEAALKAANRVGGLLFHYPAGQVQRTTEGAAALIEGKTGNPMVLITGPSKDAK